MPILARASEAFATPAQAELLRRMVRSHVVTDAERAEVERQLAEGFGEVSPSDAIDALKVTLAERKDAETVARWLRERVGV